MNILKLTLITFIISLLSLSAVAQSVNPNVFNLDKIGSHYAFTANINDKAEAKVMLESGVHGLIIDSAFIFRSPDQLDIVLVPDSTKGSFNLGGKKCKITHKSAGKVKISPNLYFEGDIFVVRDLSKSVNMYIPIQKMFNYADNNNCLIKIDIKNRVMQSMSRASFNREKESYERLEMNNNSYLNMPCVETTFETGKNENNILKGNFNLDLGNGSFLFLRSQSEAVQTFLANNPKLEIRTVYNKSTGISTGVALVLDYCKLCNFKNKDILVPITNVLPKFTTDGLIGLKFFETVIAVFDFGESGFYIKSSR